MPKTKRGIYHNLKESKYTISNSEVVFFFSSELYLQKFLDRYKENRQKQCKKITTVTDEILNFDTLADVELYQDVEKRGFFVRLYRAKITKKDLYDYAVRKLKQKESPEWFRNEGIISEQKTKKKESETTQ